MPSTRSQMESKTTSRDTMSRYGLMSSDEQEQVVTYGLSIWDSVMAESSRIHGGKALAMLTEELGRAKSELSAAISIATEAGRLVSRQELEDQLIMSDERLVAAEQRCVAMEKRSQDREDALRRECDGKIELLHDRIEAAAVRGGERNKSTVRGEEGEQEVEVELLRLFPTAEISDERRTRGRGDFVITHGAVHMMLEVKNYSKNVTKSEITKFERDMSHNPEYTCGVLASLSTGVCGKEDFSLEILHDRPVLYIHRLREDPNRLRCAMRLFEVMHSLENVDLSKTGVIDQVLRELSARRHRVAALQGMVDRHSKELKVLIAKEDEATTATLELVIGRCQ